MNVIKDYEDDVPREITTREDVEKLIARVFQITSSVTLILSLSDLDQMSYEGFNPYLMFSIALANYNAAPASMKTWANGAIESFEYCIQYMACLFCLRGNKPVKIIAKSNNTTKANVTMLRTLFHLESGAPPSSASMTLARVGNSLGQICALMFHEKKFRGIASYSMATANFPFAFRAPGVAGLIPKTGEIMVKTGSQKTMWQEDRIRIAKAAIIIACKIDKIINSNKKTHVVDPIKISNYIYISYDCGLLNSSERTIVLCKLDCMEDDGPLIRFKHNIATEFDALINDNVDFLREIDFSRFDSTPKIDNRPLRELTMSACDDYIVSMEPSRRKILEAALKEKMKKDQAKSSKPSLEQPILTDSPPSTHQSTSKKRSSSQESVKPKTESSILSEAFSALFYKTIEKVLITKRTKFDSLQAVVDYLDAEKKITTDKELNRRIEALRSSVWAYKSNSSKENGELMMASLMQLNSYDVNGNK